MVPEFVARTGGSRWNRALPGEDSGRFNLWRPTVVDRTGGSKWVQDQLAEYMDVYILIAEQRRSAEEERHE